MAALLTTTQCPAMVCTCGGAETVTVKAGKGKDRASGQVRPTLVYGPCASLVAQGWTSKVATVKWA
jgi:hypothetical protein